MVTRLQAGDARADLAHNARALVAKYCREQPLWVRAGQRVKVRVADARRHHLHQHLAGLRSFNVNGLDGQRLASGPGDGGACFHGGVLL